MAVLKIKKQSHFSTYENELVQTNKISFKSKGFLVYLLSLPHDWEVNIQYLCKEFSEGKAFFYACIKELKSAGYISHVYHRNQNGQVIKGEYIVSEAPNLLHTENQETVENPENALHSDFQDSAKQITENRNALNKYKEKKEIKKKEIAATDDQVQGGSNTGKTHLLAAAYLQVIQDRKLNPEQKLIVENTTKELCLGSQNYDPTKLAQEVITVLEDSLAFTKSGNLFYKKLNTIKKQIQNGKWQSPSNVSAAIPSLQQPVTSPQDIKQKRLIAEITLLELQKDSFQRGMNEERFKNRPEYIASCEKMIKEFDAKLLELKNTLANFENNSTTDVLLQGERNASTHPL